MEPSSSKPDFIDSLNLLLEEEMQAHTDARLRYAADAFMSITIVRERADAFMLRELEFACEMLKRTHWSATLPNRNAFTLASNAKERVSRILARRLVRCRIDRKIERKLKELDELLAARTSLPPLG